MNLFRFILAKSRGTIIAAVLFGLVSGVCSTFLITSIHRGVDPSSAGDVQLPYQFLALAIGFLVTSLLGQVPLFFLAENAVLHLRMEMVQRIFSARLRFIEELGSHRLFASLSSDIGQIANGMVQIPRVGIHGVICLGCFGYMAYLSVKVLLLMILFIVGMVAVYQFSMRWATRRFVQSRETGDDLFAQFRALTQGIKELKASRRRREAFVSELLLPTSEKYRHDRIFGLVNFQISSSVGNLGFFLVIGFIVFLLPQWQPMTDTAKSGIVLIFVFLIGPLSALFDTLPSLTQANVALMKIEKLGLDLEANSQTPQAAPAVASYRCLELREVVHTYYNEREDERFQLGPVSLALQPGEIVFLVGGNGSGKSTLGKLITGFYDPLKGQVLVDGEVVTDADRDRQRELFSSIFGDFYLFERFLGLDDPSLLERAEHYLGELHLTHKVRISAEGLSTTDLSTGQRKRLALLITYLENRPIYLFDEWASDQDPQFKQIFYTEILPDLKARGKTVLAITHDDAYFNCADRILKLQDGKLVEGAPLPHMLTEEQGRR